MIIEEWMKEGIYRRVRVCDDKIILLNPSYAEILKNREEIGKIKGSWLCATCCGNEVILGGDEGLSDGTEKREVSACDCGRGFAYATALKPIEPHEVIIRDDKKRKIIKVEWLVPALSWGKYLAVATFDGKVILVDTNSGKKVWEERFPGGVVSVEWQGDLLAIGVWGRNKGSVWVYEVTNEPRLVAATLLPSFASLSWLGKDTLVVATYQKLLFYKVRDSLTEIMECEMEEEEIYDVDTFGNQVFVVTEEGLRVFRVLL